MIPLSPEQFDRKAWRDFGGRRAGPTMSAAATPWKPMEVSAGAWFVVRHVRENSGWEREYAGGLIAGAKVMFGNQPDAQIWADGLNELKR